MPMRGRSSRLLKKGVGGVASAAGSDARSRDEGDAGAHRRGAATPQTAPRRRNRLRWLAFCSRRFSREKSSLREVFLASRVAKGQTRHPHPFFSSLLVDELRAAVQVRVFRGQGEAAGQRSEVEAEAAAAKRRVVLRAVAADAADAAGHRMGSKPGGKTGLGGVAGNGEEGGAATEIEAVDGETGELPGHVGGGIKLPVAPEEKVRQIRGREIRVAPGHARRRRTGRGSSP